MLVAIDLETLTPEERRELLAKLNDAQVRQLILDSWEKQTTETTNEQEGMVGGFHGNLQQFRSSFRRIQEAFAEKGLQFAPRRVLVETVGANNGNQEAAAAGSIDSQIPAT